MILQVTWNKNIWKWFIADVEGRMFLPDSPNCGNVHKVFKDLSFDEPNYYISTNIKCTKEGKVLDA